MAQIDVRRAHDRMHTEIDWLDSWHSFSFGGHHEPGNTGHGHLLVLNDDTVAPAGGFGSHGHADMEIVTWVLEGSLAHRDDQGDEGIIEPGHAQRMSAGTGIRHSEHNASDTEPVHFLQMWVPPDRRGVAPGYEQRDVNDALAGGGLVAVASGQGHDGAVTIHRADAVLWVARLAAGSSVDVPAGGHVHVFVAVGDAVLSEAGPLATGDAVRLTDSGPLTLTAGTDGAEVAIWVTD